MTGTTEPEDLDLEELDRLKREHLKSLKITSARQRCEALRTAVESFNFLVHVSQATRNILDGVAHALEGLDKYLVKLGDDPDLDLLSEDELEARIHVRAKAIPYLHQILGLIEHSDIRAVPSELVTPLGRLIQRLFPEARLVVVSSADLNYSFHEISQYVKDVWEKLECEPLDGFPHQVFRISIPSAEQAQVLSHSIMAHEIGHPLCQHNAVKDEVLPIRIDQHYLRRIYQALRDSVENPQDSPVQMLFDELEFRSAVTARVNAVVLSWIEELGAYFGESDR